MEVLAPWRVAAMALGHDPALWRFAPMPLGHDPALWRFAPMPLGHQGGWDEALFVLAPLVLFALLLRAAKRRAEAEQRAGEGDAPGADVEAERRAADRAE